MHSLASIRLLLDELISQAICERNEDDGSNQQKVRIKSRRENRIETN